MAEAIEAWKLHARTMELPRPSIFGIRILALTWRTLPSLYCLTLSLLSKIKKYLEYQSSHAIKLQNHS